MVGKLAERDADADGEEVQPVAGEAVGEGLGVFRGSLGTAAERVEGAAMLRARFGNATQEMFEVLKLWEGSAVARAQARRDLDARMREVIDDELDGQRAEATAAAAFDLAQATTMVTEAEAEAEPDEEPEQDEDDALPVDDDR